MTEAAKGKLNKVQQLACLGRRPTHYYAQYHGRVVCLPSLDLVIQEDSISAPESGLLAP
jgi:hypothetical protein